MLLLTLAAQAEEYRVQCPLSIEAEALQVVKTPASWTAAVQGPFWLHSAGPMDGPPSEMAVLKEDANTKRVGKKTVTKWDMTGTFSTGKWMACNYGYANDFILSKKLDERTSACTVTSAKQSSGKVDIDIRCKR
jgi:hypothetical protein